MDLTGQRLGEYELLVWLGDGAHVHAYLARQESKQRDVVIKVIKTHLASTEEYVERFHREAQAALELDHPNMVKVFEYHQEGDVLYLVEEYMPGGSLLDIFSRYRGPLPMEAVQRTVNQIASVLDYAHEHGIVHKDIKPENILYDADGNAALSDLGITKNLNREAALSRDGLEFGNPNYMPPEQWQGKPIDRRSDIYALGILIFEMLTGKLPFENPSGGSFAFVHLSHLVSEPLPLSRLRPDLPPAVEYVICKAIDKTPEKRFNTAGELAEAFEQALAGTYTIPEVDTTEAQAGAVEPPARTLFAPIRLPGAAPSAPRPAPPPVGINVTLVLLALLVGFILGRWSRA